PGEYYVSAVARNDGVGRGIPPQAAAQVAQAVQDALAGRGGRGGRGAGVAAALAGLAPTDEQDQLMYAPTYYPGVGSPAEARAVTLGVSQELTDIDFALQLVRTARVTGHVENPDGSWTAQGNVNLAAQGGTRAGAPGTNFG